MNYNKKYFNPVQILFNSNYLILYMYNNKYTLIIIIIYYIYYIYMFFTIFKSKKYI